MTTLLATILFLCAAICIAVMLVQARRGTVDLLSVRNFFMVGMIIFQMVSGILSFMTGSYGEFHILNPGVTGSIFVGILLLFLAIFWLCYSRGWLVRRAPWRLPMAYPAPTPASILPLAFVLLATGLIFRIVIARTVPVFGVLADMMAVGLIASAAGLAMWVWAPRLWNPAVALPAGLVILIAISGLIFQTFGRRDVLSVLIAILFAGYHSRWIHLGFARMGMRLLIIGAVGLLFLAAFSTVRFTTFKLGDYASVIKSLAEADIRSGLKDMAAGQYAAANSMWLIESRPREYPFDTLHSAIAVVAHPIPRVLWPDKPIGLGYEMVSQGKIRGVQRGYTVGPGIVGHIWNDNPLLALIPYAVVLGLFLRFLDEHVRVHRGNPFVIIPVIVGVGELIGMPRGELGMFLFRALAAMAAAWVGLRVAWRVLGLFSSSVANAEYTTDTSGWAGEEDGYGHPDYPTDGSDLGESLARTE